MPLLPKYLYIIVLMLSAVTADAQLIEGVIYDKDSKEPISYASVTNKRTRYTVYTSAGGQFRMEAAFGDTILVAHPGYLFSSKVINTLVKSQWIYIEREKHQLEEVEILSDMAKFKKDSADKHTIYRKTIKDAAHAPSLSLSNGIAMEGLFSSLALWISGKGKRNKKFVETMMTQERANFTALKYNPQIVNEQTGLNEEEAMKFMLEYPMPYDYVRAASDLEIKMWIRTNYREWVKKTENKK